MNPHERRVEHADGCGVLGESTEHRLAVYIGAMYLEAEFLERPYRRPPGYGIAMLGDGKRLAVAACDAAGECGDTRR